MPEAQNISHQESFLFQFANIHCVKKVLSCYRPEKKLNRTPTKEPAVILIPNGELAELRMAYKDDGLSELEIEARLKGYESNRSITRNGTIYDIEYGKPVCIGNTFFNPELFEAFCCQHGVEGVSNDHGLILWEHCQQALRAMVDNDYSAIQYWFRHIKERPDICLPNKGGKETFEAKIYIPLLEFLYQRVQTEQEEGSDFSRFHNNRKCRSSLKQCACCGRFEFDKAKRGKPSVFCSKECRVYFGRASREKAGETDRSNRKAKGVNEKLRILDWLCNEKECTPAEAIKFYDRRSKESARSVTSLKEFKRTYIG